MVKTWIVYKHVSPSNKVYAGITSQSDIKRRWFRGSGYNRCPIFMKAILKYGWDNIKHQVLFTNLTEARAENLEKDLIGKPCPEELRRKKRCYSLWEEVHQRANSS